MKKSLLIIFGVLLSLFCFSHQIIGQTLYDNVKAEQTHHNPSNLDLIFKFIENQNQGNAVIMPQPIFRFWEMFKFTCVNKDIPRMTRALPYTEWPAGYKERGTIVTDGAPSGKLDSWVMNQIQIFDFTESFNFGEGFFSSLNKELEEKTGFANIFPMPQGDESCLGYLIAKFEKTWEMKEWQWPFKHDGKEDTIPFIYGGQIVSEFHRNGIYEISLGDNIFMRLGFDENNINFQQLEKFHTGTILGRIPRKREVWIPKMDIQTSINLKDFFPADSKFSFIAKENSPISDFKQICKISLTKEKISAASATFFVAAALDGPAPDKRSIVFDKPFKFVLIDKNTGACLVAGHYVSPSYGAHP